MAELEPEPTPFGTPDGSDMEETMREPTEPKVLSLETLDEHLGRLFDMQQKTAKVVEHIHEERIIRGRN